MSSSSAIRTLSSAGRRLLTEASSLPPSRFHPLASHIGRAHFHARTGSLRQTEKSQKVEEKVDTSSVEELEKPAVTKPFGDAYEGSLVDSQTLPHLPALQLTNKPFIKNLFIGEFDTDMLTYPEVATNKDLEDLDAFFRPYQDLFDTATGLDFDKREEVPLEFITAMADVGLFAQSIPSRYGGLGLNSTYLTKMADVTGAIPMANNLIEVHHNMTVRAIVHYGSEEQKERYLPKLATGEYLASLCLYENKTHLDFQSLKTQANVSADTRETTFSLTGYKTWVANANIADLFLVVAIAPLELMGQWKDQGVTMFLVESNSSGIEVLEPISGIVSPRGLPLFDVAFNHVPLKKENILGVAGEGDLVCIRTMTTSAHHTGASFASLLRRFTNLLQKFLIKEKIGDTPLYENQAYQAVLCDLQCKAYVMESMAYMTGQIADEFEEPDLSLEQAATRIWCVDELQSTLTSVMEVLGLATLEKNHPIMNTYIDTLALKNYPIPLELMKQYIALSGLRHAALERGDVHRSLRDQLNNPQAILKKMFFLDEIQLPASLHKYVHDLLYESAVKIENICFKFEKAIENYLIKGPKTNSFLQDQYELQRIAWIVSQIYAMTAAISNASRALCLGIQYANHQSVLAQYFVNTTFKKVEWQIENLSDPNRGIADFHRQMSEDIVEAEGYMPRHPLTRSY